MLIGWVASGIFTVLVMGTPYWSAVVSTRNQRGGRGHSAALVPVPGPGLTRSAGPVRGVREQLVRDDRDGVRRELVPGAVEPDETSARDLGGERRAVADREERVVLAVQHERRRANLAEPLAPARAVIGEGDVGRRAADI